MRWRWPAPAPAFELAYKITKRGGTTTTGGLANPNARVSLPPVHLVAEERTIKGSYMGSCVPPATFRASWRSTSAASCR